MLITEDDDVDEEGLAAAALGGTDTAEADIPEEHSEAAACRRWRPARTQQHQGNLEIQKNSLDF